MLHLFVYAPRRSSLDGDTFAATVRTNYPPRCCTLAQFQIAFPIVKRRPGYDEPILARYNSVQQPLLLPITTITCSSTGPTLMANCFAISRFCDHSDPAPPPPHLFSPYLHYNYKHVKCKVPSAPRIIPRENLVTCLSQCTLENDFIHSTRDS